MRAYPMGAIAVILMASSGFITSVEAAQPPTGVWIDHTGRGAVEIKDCGDGNLCGHVVWLKDTNDAKGCGLQILGNVKPVGRGQWDKGWIYSPEKKQKFTVELTPLDDNRLRVKGYKGIKLFSKTMIWHRPSGALQRCDTTTTARTDPASQTTRESGSVTPSVPSTKNEISRANRPASESGAASARSESQEQDKQSAEVVPEPNGHQRFDAVTEPRERADLRDGDRRDEDGRYSEDRTTSLDKLEGLKSLLEGFTSENGFEVGDGYGIKVEESPTGEKNCRLKVPYVTVRFPCDD